MNRVSDRNTPGRKIEGCLMMLLGQGGYQRLPFVRVVSDIRGQKVLALVEPRIIVVVIW